MSGSDHVCVYCGNLADSEDHVVPRHLLVRAEELGLDLSRVMRMRSWVHPACRECNKAGVR
jgi:5-methylcytosine-specific restriction endonuclease McrA